MKHLTLIGALALAALCASAPAFAQAGAIDGKLVVPVGDWGAALLQGSATIAIAAAAWGLRHVPPEATFALRMLRVDQLLEKAVRYAINSTAGAVAGKVLTVNVGNQVVERAGEYALRHAPALVQSIGGLAKLREKIIARIALDENAQIANVAEIRDAIHMGQVKPAPAAAGAPS